MHQARTVQEEARRLAEFLHSAIYSNFAPSLLFFLLAAFDIYLFFSEVELAAIVFVTFTIAIIIGLVSHFGPEIPPLISQSIQVSTVKLSVTCSICLAVHLTMLTMMIGWITLAVSPSLRHTVERKCLYFCSRVGHDRVWGIYPTSRVPAVSLTLLIAYSPYPAVTLSMAFAFLAAIWQAHQIGIDLDTWSMRMLEEAERVV